MSYPFELEEIDGALDGPRILITAGIHGDEFEGIEATRILATELTSDKLRGTVQLVPVANLSAFERRERTGRDGLDMARIFPGNPGGTPTEQAAFRLGRLIEASDYYVDLHSGGLAVEMEPMAGYMLVDSEEILADQRQIAISFGLPIVWGTTAKLDGRSLSVARDAGVPAIYAEFGGGGVCSPDGVEAYVSGCLNILTALDMMPDGAKASPPPSSPIVVEDRRPDSGFLQIQNPSPSSGQFSSLVRLGQPIAHGETLGHVSGTPVAADRTGRVIGLRARPEVDRGDTLAVIMDTHLSRDQG